MSSVPTPHGRDHLDRVFLHALEALPPGELPAMDAQLAACADCRRELASLRPMVQSFVGWPTDVLRPSPSLWDRLAERIAGEDGGPSLSAAGRSPWREPEWREVAPGIHCKILAADPEKSYVSMLVRLEPGTAYPPHRHSDIEELHLLDGELIVDDTRLSPGDYIRGEAGTMDHRVWSETGCTCVLLTSSRDVLL